MPGDPRQQRTVGPGTGHRRVFRAVGLVGHILEESRKPMAEEIWYMVDELATAHFRPPVATTGTDTDAVNDRKGK